MFLPRVERTRYVNNIILAVCANADPGDAPYAGRIEESRVFNGTTGLLYFSNDKFIK